MRGRLLTEHSPSQPASPPQRGHGKIEHGSQRRYTHDSILNNDESLRCSILQFVTCSPDSAQMAGKGAQVGVGQICPPQHPFYNKGKEWDFQAVFPTNPPHSLCLWLFSYFSMLKGKASKPLYRWWVLTGSRKTSAEIYNNQIKGDLFFATPWTVTHQASLSMGVPRQEYWSGLPFPSPGDLPDPENEHASLESPALARGFFTTSTQEAF